MVKTATTFFSTVLTLSVFFVFMLPSSAAANFQDYGIEVKGQGSVLVAPDSFTLSVAIIEQGRLTDKIRAVVDHKSNQVLNIAQSLGIKPESINSARVSLRVIEKKLNVTVHGLDVNQRLANNQKSKVYVGVNPANQRNKASLQYFELSRNITVNFSDIKDYDQFLNQIIKIGVSRISPLTMSVDDTDKYYQQALAQAITNAKTKAQQIAKQAAQSLGKLIYVKEVTSNHYLTQYNAPMRSESAAYSHNSQVGNQTISASVLVKYAIE